MLTPTEQITLSQFEAIDGLMADLLRMGEFETCADPRGYIRASNRLLDACIDATSYAYADDFASGARMRRADRHAGPTRHDRGRGRGGRVMALAPCPFCGSEPEAVENRPPYAKAYGVNCANERCLIAPWTRWHPTREAAASIWNARAAL